MKESEKKELKKTKTYIYKEKRKEKSKVISLPQITYIIPH